MDDADDIVPSTILNYLSKDPLSRRAWPQPASAVAMSKFIVDFCVGFFSHLQADAGPNVTKAEGRRSTRQLFSDAINRAVCLGCYPSLVCLISTEQNEPAKERWTNSSFLLCSP